MKAAQGEKFPYDEHLETCEECRTELSLIRLMTDAGDPALETPSAEAIQRFAAVSLVEEPARGRARQGQVTFDSWQERAVPNVRDLRSGLVRRLCLEAATLTLEIVAEWQHGVWEFVGRVYDNGQPQVGYLLCIGKKRLLPKSGGFFFWQSQTAPSRMIICSADKHAEFGELSW